VKRWGAGWHIFWGGNATSGGEGRERERGGGRRIFIPSSTIPGYASFPVYCDKGKSGRAILHSMDTPFFSYIFWKDVLRKATSIKLDLFLRGSSVVWSYKRPIEWYTLFFLPFYFFFIYTFYFVFFCLNFQLFSILRNFYVDIGKKFLSNAIRAIMARPYHVHSVIRIVFFFFFFFILFLWHVAVVQGKTVCLILV